MSEHTETRLDKNGLLYLVQRLRTIFGNLFQAKEAGKGLSTNDYTTAEKTKLSGIAEGATANVGTVTGITMNGASKTVGANGVVDLGTVITQHQDISGKANLTDIPTKTSDLTNDSGFTTNVGTVTGITMNSASKTVDANGVVDLGTVITQHQDISGKADITDIPTKTSDLTNDSGFLTQHQDITGKANVDSPAFTGIPTTPTAATASDNTQVANTAFVKAAIAAALSGKIDLQFLFLQTLPATGVVGTFYFIPNPDSVTGDEWIEYVWDATNSKFEKIGSAAVDLTGYFNTENLPAITNAEIDTILAT